MLKKLSISNYAIIENLDIEFFEGLNTITGETGAGKSILLGALGLLAGGRAEASVIKNADKSCVVEGSFDIAGYDLEDFFEANDLDFESLVTLRRIISASGKSRAYIGELPVTLTVLKELTDKLIDIHSQHQSLLLSHTDFQTRIVDAVAVQLPQVTQYCTVFKDLRAAARELARLEEHSADAVKRRDYLQFQAEELLAAKVRVGEMEELEQEQNALTHAEEIATGLNYTSQALDNDESGVLSALKTSISQISRVRKHMPALDEIHNRLESSYLELKDLSSEVASIAEKVELNPQRLEVVEQRISTLYNLMRKHGVEKEQGLVDVAAEIDKELLELDNSELNIAQTQARLNSLKQQAEQKARALSDNRSKVASKIEKHTEKTLADLGIKNAVFKIEITPAKELTLSGMDNIRFLFSANDGTPALPIEQVASGGEISRLMLAIKGLVSQSMKLPTIIFDEIDAGVSGAVADKMGEIIWAMSSTMQVINITHLPQIASKGKHHYHVYKDQGTNIQKLDADQRLEHIAAMLSGSKITPAARAQAAELLKSNA